MRVRGVGAGREAREMQEGTPSIFSTTSERSTALTAPGCSSICSSASSSRPLVVLPRITSSGRVSWESPSTSAAHTRENCLRCDAQKRRSERSSSRSADACSLDSTDETSCRRSHTSSASSSDVADRSSAGASQAMGGSSGLTGARARCAVGTHGDHPRASDCRLPSRNSTSRLQERGRRTMRPGKYYSATVSSSLKANLSSLQEWVLVAEKWQIQLLDRKSVV